MIKVTLRENEHIEGALRKLKRMFEKSGIPSKTRKNEGYEKPTARRKFQATAAKKRAQKKRQKERFIRKREHEKVKALMNAVIHNQMRASKESDV